MRRFLALLALLAVLAPSAGSGSENWFRYPAISPDGSTIVFSQGGDLFRVPSTGGLAVPLTLNPAWDGYPVWSPDGQWLAFASDRHGNLDIFVMPAMGGEARRLTWHSFDDIPTSFMPEGEEILFSARRVDDVANSTFPTGALPELYAVSVDGGTPRMVLTTPALGAQPDGSAGRLLYFDRKGYENRFRKHHVSSVTRDVWMVELDEGTHTKMSDFEGEDRTPVWASDEQSFFFLSERAGDFNVFRQDLASGAVIPLTDFERHPVRSLTASDADLLAFSWHGDLYTLVPGEEPRLLDVAINVDRPEPEVTMEKLGRGVTEIAVSPDGEEIAFVARGEVFVTSADFATTRRITDTPEQERSIEFSPDGKRLVYAGERGGSWNVYMAELGEGEEWFFAATQVSETEVVATDDEEFQPRFSPDGEEVAFLAERTVLKVKNLESGSVRTVMPGKWNYSYADGDQWYDWSPDGEWFVVTFLSRGRYYAEAIGLVKSDGKSDPIDISNSGYRGFGPSWAMDGGAIIWGTDRYGQKNHGSWGGESDVIAAFLDRETFDRFRRDKEARALEKGRGKKDKKKGEGKTDEEDDEDEDNGKDDEKEKGPREIDFDRIEERTVRLTLHSSDLADWALLPEGTGLIYLARFEEGFDLWGHDFVEEETKLLFKLGADRASFHLSGDGKSIVVLADGQIKKFGVKSGKDGLDLGKPESVKISPAMNVKPDAERAYMFDHIWRQVQQKWYDPELHGVDWQRYRVEYAPKLAGINNNRDFAELMSEMLGELNGSHTGSGWFGDRDNEESTASLGVYFDREHDGDGERIAEILERGPLAEKELGIAAGDILLSIDGVELDDTMNYYELLANRAGERVRLGLRNDDGEFFAVVEPITARQELRLRYGRWVRQRRDLVEEISDGRIGYVHVQGMNDRSYRTVYSEIMGRNFDKEAIIVDTRFNGGGWLHDDLVVLLGGMHYVDLMPRNQAVPGQRFYGEPGKRWWKPSAVVMGEGNYSDAHFFPWAYRKNGIGPLVGMPVPGTSTAVWWETLHTGDLYFGIPQVGTIDLDDGTYLENAQLEPDHEVRISAEDAVAGRDPQLEKAVEVLLESVD
jgi:Tol biopolymer transport system component/C-terminal processing protease CtpA/Prc